MAVNIYDLPLEVLSEVFSYLNLADLKDSSLVCKQWYYASLHPRLQKRVTIKLDPSVKKTLSMLGNRTGFNLMLSNLEGPMDEHALLECQAVIGPRLRSLNLKDSNLTERAFVGLIKQCTGLQQLNLSCCESILYSGNLSRQLNGLQIPTLTELNLSSMKHLSDASLSALFRLSTNLESLSLAGCKIVFKSTYMVSDRPSSAVLTFTHVYKHILDHAKTLKSLDFSHTNINDECMQLLLKMPDLQLNSLTVNATQITNQSLGFLSEKQSQIIRLSISHNKELLAIGKAISQLTQLENLTAHKVVISPNDLMDICSLDSLKELAISGSVREKISLKQAQAIAYNLESLTYFDASYCPGLDEDSLMIMCREMRELKYLNFDANQHVTDSVLCIISASMPKLEYLSLGWCKKISDIGLLGLSNLSQTYRTPEDACKCDRNDHAYFTYTPPVKDIAPAQHIPFLTTGELASAHANYSGETAPISRLKNLIYLNLSVCPKITDYALEKVIHFQRLAHLDLSHCVNVTDNSLVAIANQNPLLENLSVVSCQLISDLGLKAIIKNCHRLTALNISACTRVSDGAIDFLVSQRRKLRYFNVKACNISPYALERLEASTNIEDLHRKFSGVAI